MSTASPPSPPPTPQPPQHTPQADPSMMTWIDHLKELRNRLIKASMAVLAGLIIGIVAVYYDDFALVTYVLDHLRPIVGDVQYQVTRSTEFFTTTMKLGLGIGIALAMPVIVYQLLAYVVPGLTTRERRIIYFVLPFVVLLFISGVAFGWFVTVPVAFRFLLGLGVGVVEVRPTFDNVLSVLTRLLLVNGVTFQLPIIVYSIIWLGAVERKTLAKYRRYAILVITIIAAVVSPTGDAVSLAIFAVPMYLLYELGLLLAWIAPRKKTVIVTPSAE